MSHTSRLPSGAALLVAALVSWVLTPTPAGAAAAAATPPSSAQDGWTARPATYPATTVETDLAVPMSDGTVLRADLRRPVATDGTPVATRLPVVVTITAYNKSAQSATGLAGGDPDYLVRRGYLHLTVDARGTGSSGGTWCAFCTRENTDAGEIMQWAHEQPWSNGRTAMSGPSYMGISQLFAAAARPDGLRALFPQVPAADVYRDVVASGGALDVGFIPLWIGLVNATGLIPPAFTAADPGAGIGTVLTHLLGNGAFSAHLLADAVAGGEAAHDGPFYAQRSPITVADRIRTPTFLVGGHDDLFQRGTPLIHEALARRGVPVRTVIGPWDHLQASAGTGLEDAGYGTLAELQLRWFDHHVKGLPGQRIDEIAPVTRYEIGTGRWVRDDAYPASDLSARTYHLTGSAIPSILAGGLERRAAATPATSLVPPVPAQGLCTRSASQWTAGIVRQVMPANPCLADNGLNDALGPVFETAPLARDEVIDGPLNARLHVSSTSGDGLLAVTVSDVAPDGSVTRLTGGWQVIAHRTLDRSRSRFLDGTLVQPYHPFTADAVNPLAPGEVAPVDVEVFPTLARIRAGHRLRIAVQAFDVPHLLPALPNLLGSVSAIQVHTGPQHPSRISFGRP